MYENDLFFFTWSKKLLKKKGRFEHSTRTCLIEKVMQEEMNGAKGRRKGFP